MPPTHLTSETPPFTLNELPAINSGIRDRDDDCYYSSNILREIPTKKISEPNATNVIDILDDDDNTIPIATAQQNATPASTFLHEWEAFYCDFKQSTTYALVHSSAARLLPSLIDDDNGKIHECAINQLPTHSSAGLCRLRHSIRELEKVNIQLASFVELTCNPVPCQPTLCTIDNDQPYPQCLELQCAKPPQYVPTMEPPPALNSSPASTLAYPVQHPTQQLDPDPQRAAVPQAVPTLAPPPAPNLAAGSIPNQTQQSSPTDRQHSTIPNWAQPAVANPASLAGMSYTGQRPPLRPERKTIPFKKKTQTKPHVANQKDFLQPP